MSNVLFIQLPFIVELILWALGGGVIGGLLGGLIGLLIGALAPEDASRIAIFGSKGSGKTTLWKQLKGELENKEYELTYGKQKIDSFSIQYKGKTKTIEKSADFSGADDMVKLYHEIIEEGTFIYYLIDLTKLKEFKRETRARLQVISKITKEKKIEKNAGLRLIGTHYDDYRRKTGKSKDQARIDLVEVLKLNDVKDVVLDDVILIAELTNKDDINQILDQIIE